MAGLEQLRVHRTVVLPTSAVPTGLLSFFHLTQDFILGYFLPSLRDWNPHGLLISLLRSG